ncbi:MAG: ribosome maturation factor RimP [Tissierellia bacterium]|nr:ribosome maturation factor RimP [Tissierellia bacterium]MDD4725633.1 ribosome maturation factor RimP [Tissierellia bacterium]
MSKKEIMNKVIDICNPIVESLDFELVDIEYIKEFGSYYLRVYIDKLGGITLDDCQKFSQLLSDILDKDDPITNAYYLEVSSPGLDRPLKTDQDLNRNIGKEIEVSLYKPFDGIKLYEGKLKEFNNESLIIINEVDELINIPRDIISLIKLALKF